MGTYITSEGVLYGAIPQADLLELLDDDGDGTVDAAVFALVVADVESLFESYVSRRYSVPLDVTDSRILASAKMYCARLMEYFCHARRRVVTPEIKARYDQTIAELKDIRDGRLGLCDTVPVEATCTTAYYTGTDNDRDFTASSMRMFGGGSSRTGDSDET